MIRLLKGIIVDTMTDAIHQLDPKEYNKPTLIEDTTQMAKSIVNTDTYLVAKEFERRGYKVNYEFVLAIEEAKHKIWKLALED